MRLATWLGIFSLTFWVGCVGVPPKPTVEVGSLDFPAQEVIAVRSDNPDLATRVPLESYDKATCFKPTEWELYVGYVHQLEAFAKQCEKAAAGLK